MGRRLSKALALHAEDLNSVLKIHVTRQMWWCVLVTIVIRREEHRQTPGAHWLASLAYLAKFQASKSLVSKDKGTLRMTLNSPMTSTHIHIQKPCLKHSAES